MILPYRFGSLVAINKYYFSLCFSLSLKLLLYITLCKITIWENGKKKKKNLSRKPRVWTVHPSQVPLRDTGYDLSLTSRGLSGGRDSVIWTPLSSERGRLYTFFMAPPTCVEENVPS